MSEGVEVRRQTVHILWFHKMLIWEFKFQKRFWAIGVVHRQNPKNLKCHESEKFTCIHVSKIMCISV